MSARISPLQELGQSPDAAQLASLCEFVGYRPRALMTMARKPGLLGPILSLVQAALRAPGLLDEKLRFLVACEACRVAACGYSATHAVHAAAHIGVPLSQLAELDQWGVASENGK